MTNRFILPISVAIVLLLTAVCGADSSNPVLREEAKVIIDEVEEIWLLEWNGATLPVCAPEGNDWYTCPCIGFAFGEAGDLELVRKRPGHQDERFSLTHLFEYGEPPGPTSDRIWAVLPRWDEYDDDHDKLDSPILPAEVKARPVRQIMKFADYDHDGRASEFLLHIGNLPCGKNMTIAAGISRKNPYLHAFTRFKSPTEPLILRTQHWEALKNATAPITVLQWQCGDHGSDEEEEYLLQAENGTIRAARRTYTCTNGKRGALLTENEF